MKELKILLKHYKAMENAIKMVDFGTRRKFARSITPESHIVTDSDFNTERDFFMRIIDMGGARPVSMLVDGVSDRQSMSLKIPYSEFTKRLKKVITPHSTSKRKKVKLARKATKRNN